MQNVLLAIEGGRLDPKAIRYAVQLCKRIRAGLSILQVVGPRKGKEGAKNAHRVGRRMRGRAQAWFEGMMTAATFAESGEFETAREVIEQTGEEIERIMNEPENIGTSFQFTIKAGNPEEEIVDYVRRHRNVVITVYDSPMDGSGSTGNKSSAPDSITRRLPVPLVVVR